MKDKKYKKPEKREPFLISKETLEEYGCSEKDAGILFGYIKRMCPTVMKQVLRTFIRNGKPYSSLRHVHFADVTNVKHCAEDMLCFASDKRSTKENWKRILDLAKLIEVDRHKKKKEDNKDDG